MEVCQVITISLLCIKIILNKPHLHRHPPHPYLLLDHPYLLHLHHHHHQPKFDSTKYKNQIIKLMLEFNQFLIPIKILMIIMVNQAQIILIRIIISKQNIQITVTAITKAISIAILVPILTTLIIIIKITTATIKNRKQ